VFEQRFDAVRMTRDYLDVYRMQSSARALGSAAIAGGLDRRSTMAQHSPQASVRWESGPDAVRLALS
jgi:hypothetical protein